VPAILLAVRLLAVRLRLNVRRSAPHIGGYGGSSPREIGTSYGARYDGGFCHRAP